MEQAHHKRAVHFRVILSYAFTVRRRHSLQADIHIDSMETIDGRACFTGSILWRAQCSLGGCFEENESWDVVLTTPADATEEQRYERQLLEESILSSSRIISFMRLDNTTLIAVALADKPIGPA